MPRQCYSLANINNQPVRDRAGFEKLVNELPKDRAVALRVWRNGTTQFVAFTPDSEDVG